MEAFQVLPGFPDVTSYSSSFMPCHGITCLAYTYNHLYGPSDVLLLNFEEEYAQRTVK